MRHIKKSVTLGLLALAVAGGVLMLQNTRVDAASGHNHAHENAGEMVSADKMAALEIQPGDRVLGRMDAPVTIVEYASMTCSHCADFHNKYFSDLKTQHIDTGDVRFVLRPMPWDNIALAISKIALCAPEDQYYNFMDAFFVTQKEWIRASNPLETIKKIARMGGMGSSDVDACLKNQEVHDAMTVGLKTATEVLGVNSTPTFFVNGQRYNGVQTFDELSTTINIMKKRP